MSETQLRGGLVSSGAIRHRKGSQSRLVTRASRGSQVDAIQPGAVGRWGSQSQILLLRFATCKMGLARRWVLSQDWGLQNGRRPQWPSAVAAHLQEAVVCGNGGRGVGGTRLAGALLCSGSGSALRGDSGRPLQPRHCLRSVHGVTLMIWAKQSVHPPWL